MTSNALKTHHKPSKLCSTRPAYRQGRKLTAIKVYTVSQESQHLFIYGVPQINLRSELKNRCFKFGAILKIHVAESAEPMEAFTECYHVHYERIQSARMAKRCLDGSSFFGGILHVVYAPEFESVHETRFKLMQRKCSVLKRVCEGYSNEEEVIEKGLEMSQGPSKVHQETREVVESSEDPILAPSRKRMRTEHSFEASPQSEDKIIEEKERRNVQVGKFIGPCLPNQKLQLLPSNVMKNVNKLAKYENSTSKKIVFRNMNT